MKKYLKLYALMFVSLLLIFQIVYADNDDLGYRGHDLYFLNGFDVDIAGKNVVFEVNDDKLSFKGEYILYNHTEKIVEVVLGLPSDNVENLIITDKSSVLKFFRRNRSFIEKNYIFEHLPKEDKWSTVNLWLKAGESRVISINYDTKIVNDSKGIYTLIYENNIETINPNNSKACIIFNDFKPYNMINVSNIELEKIFYNQGVQSLFYINNNGRDVRIDFELTEKLAIDRLDFSTAKKLKNISGLFKAKDYDGVILLCDEYINNPSDSSIDINQIKYIKAEAYRYLIKHENYLETIKTINLNKLYPFRLKYKILFDIDGIFNGEIDNPEIAIIMKSIQENLNESNDFFSRWMIHNKKDYSSIDEIEINTMKEEVEKEGKLYEYFAFLKLDKVNNLVKENKFIYLIIIIFVFFLGYIIGKFSRRKRRKVPYYTFKR